MTEEKHRKDFVGFARDIQELRYTLRSALGLSPMRPFERMRTNTQTLSERLRPQEQHWQGPQPESEQGQKSKGQRAVSPFRGFGIIDRFLQPLQPGQPEEAVSPEEAEEQRQAEEEERWRIQEERRREEIRRRVKRSSDLSIIE